MRPAVEALIEVLREYVGRRGEIVISTARAAGQERVKIAFRGLYRSLPEDLGYARFWDIVGEIMGDEEALRELEALGIRIVRLGEEWYLEVPLRLLESLLGRRVYR